MKEKHIRKPWEKFGFTDVVIYVLLATITFVTLFPFWNSIILSFNDGKDAQVGGIYFWPRKFTLANYEQVFENTEIWMAFFISTMRTIIGTTSSLFVTSLFAYAASKPYLKFRKFYMILLLISMYFSGGMIPTFLVIKDLNLLNSFWVYVIPWMFNAFYAQIFISFFRGIPGSLIESAKMDGATEWTIYFKMILPLSKPVLAAIALFTAVNHWNAWNDNLLYVKKDHLNTLSFLFVKMIKAQEYLENAAASTGIAELGRLSQVSSTSLQLATMMVAIIPIICIYPFVQKHFTSGIMIGSIKG